MCLKAPDTPAEPDWHSSAGKVQKKERRDAVTDVPNAVLRFSAWPPLQIGALDLCPDRLVLEDA